MMLFECEKNVIRNPKWEISETSKCETTNQFPYESRFNSFQINANNIFPTSNRIIMILRFHIPHTHTHNTHNTHNPSFARMCERCSHTAKQQAVFVACKRE